MTRFLFLLYVPVFGALAIMQWRLVSYWRERHRPGMMVVSGSGATVATGAALFFLVAPLLWWWNS